ncbi:MAG: hypothetical protein JWR79_1512 [Tardiphaga sp.]|nr:hypothetical protein [Tardiphaga sp.]
MTGIGRHLSAALVAIAMIAAQVLPAWAGCHSVKHAATAFVVNVMADAAVGAGGHHSMTHASTHASQASIGQPPADAGQADAAQIETPDQSRPTKADLCLGNCGCACGLSGAFVLATATMIDAPHGITLERPAPALAASLGRTPDGPRRPPRTTA